MSNGTDTQPDTGMLSRTGARKSPLATVLDLYKNDLAFRGLTDFAAIGAVVMMFLSPPASVTWPWSTGTGGAGGGNAIHSITPASGVTTSGLVLPIVYPPWVASPNISGIIIDIDDAAFASSSAADRPRLQAARLAVSVNKGPDVADILREANGNDRNVAYLRGIGLLLRNTPADNAASQALLQSALAAGNAAAGGILGWLALGTRTGVTLTKDDGQRLIEAAAAAGDRQAMRLSAVAYISGAFGRLDPPKARDFARKAADAGDLPAMLLYSRLLADSLGGPGDGKAAESYLRKAAAGGLTSAQHTLGLWLLAQFDKGLAPDPKEAQALLERSYQKGHFIAALNDLTYFHAVSGKTPPYVDAKRAFEYAQMCSAFQDPICQFNSGASLTSGSGGVRDPIRARAHYAIAQGLNYAPAADRIKQIDATLSPADRQASAQYETLLRSQLKPLPPMIWIQHAAIDPGPAPAARAPDRLGATSLPRTTPSTGPASPTIPKSPITQQTTPDLAQCRNASVAIDDRIAACTRVIQAGTTTAAEAAEAFHKRGELHYGAARTAQAFADYDEAVRRVPGNGTYLLDRASSNLARDKLQEAFDDYEAGLKIKPESPAGLAGRAETHRRLNRPDQALADATSALGIDRTMSYARAVRAKVYFDRKQWAEVIREATEGLGVNPNDAVLLEQRAKAYAERGGDSDLDLALADYNDLVRRGVTGPVILTARGRVYHRKGNAFLDKAMDDYTLAASLGGHSDLPHYYRAQIRFDRGQYADAIADLDQAIDQHKVGDTSNYWLRGRAKLELKDYDGAETDFTRQIEVKPDDGNGYYWRGLTRTNRIDTLVDRCREAAKRETRSNDLTGGPCARPIPYSEALQDLNTAIDRASNVANASHTAGRLLAKWGRLEDALRAYSAAIAAAPKSSNSMIAMGIIYLDQLKNERAALQKFNEAIVADPSNLLGYSNRANILARYPASRQQAIADFRRALEIDRNDTYSQAGLRRLGVNP